MKIAFFDPFSGASGDMVLGALVDAGLSFSTLAAELGKLGLEGYTLRQEATSQHGIHGTRVVVGTSETTLARSWSTIRMLIEGHADAVSAKRLGVSPRTYAGYVADLKQEYESDTRFQLGYVMGQQGLTGDDATD